MKLILLLIAFALPLPFFGQGLPTGPYIYVVGKAKRSIDPDIVVLKAIVSAAHEEQAIARANVVSQAEKVFAVLDAASIPPTDVSSHEISVDGEYRYEDRNRKLAGYRVSQIFTITIRDIEKVAGVASKLIDGYVLQLEVSQVRSSKQEGVVQELKTSALLDARRQAEDIAKTTGQRIVSVYAVSPVSFSDLRSSFLGNGTRGMKTFGAASEFRIRIPQVELESVAHVIFNIQQP